MPRVRRKYSNITNIYHIILRGNDKQDIFYDEQDKYVFLKYLKENKGKYNFDIYAYCLMDNHIHMVLQDINKNLSQIMKSLATRYAIYFNKKYDRIGHLFQDRYLSKTVETQSYFINVCRYIHQNPVLAGIAKIENYKWSSYKEYINEPKIISDELLLRMLNSNQNFVEFHKVRSNDIKSYAEYEMKQNLKDEQVQNYIVNTYKIKSPKEILEWNKSKRDNCIRELKNLRIISGKQIARVIGVSYYIVQRA